MLNEVVAVGQIYQLPKQTVTKDGRKELALVLKVSRPYKNNHGLVEDDFIPCLVWKGLSQQILECCEKGSFICIKGRLETFFTSCNEELSNTRMLIKAEHIEILDKYFYKGER